MRRLEEFNTVDNVIFTKEELYWLGYNGFIPMEERAEYQRNGSFISSGLYYSTENITIEQIYDMIATCNTLRKLNAIKDESKIRYILSIGT